MLIRFKHIYFLIFSLLVALVSCKDDVETETIFPQEYFPVYPGSWWLYSNGELKTTGADYILHSFENDISSPYTTEEAYVPYWDGHYVYGYSITQNSTEFPLKLLLNVINNTPWKVGRFEGNDILRKRIGNNIKVSIVQYPYNDPSTCITELVEVTRTFNLDTPYMDLLQVSNCSDPDICDTVFVTDTAGLVDTLFFEWHLFTTYDSTFFESITTCDSIRTYDSVIVVKEYIDALDEDTCWFSKEYYAKNIGLIKREIGSCADSSATLTDFELIRYYINK
jgi:hypothetical protein